MKKISRILFFIIILVFAIIGLCSCGEEDIIEFDITFESNGGSDVAPIKTTGNATLSIPQNPTKDGYIFDGWYWDNGTFNRKFTANSLLDEPIESDMTVYAKWKSPQQVDDYLIAANDFEIEGNDLYLEVSNATESFSFIDKLDFASEITYFVSRDEIGMDILVLKTLALNEGDNNVYVLAMINNDIVNIYNVTIRRRPMYNITFDGGVQSQTIEEKDLVIEPSVPKKLGYTFEKWTLDNNEYDFDTPIQSDVQLNATWIANEYTITLDVNGGESLEQNEIPIIYDSLFSIEEPIRAGYTFSGWYYNINGDNTKITNDSGAALNQWNIAEDTTLYAKWSINSYEITLTQNLLESGTVEGDGIKEYDSEISIEATTNAG